MLFRSAFSLPTLISLAAPVLILIGAILNKQQAKVMVPYAGYSPQPGQPYPPMPEQPYPPQQAPYQPPYQPMPEQQPYQPPYEQPPSEE